MISKPLSILTLLLGLGLVLKAQNNNAILFTENGEQFQVILNGILQNSKAETNVKMTGLPAPSYKCRILFADTRLGYMDFNMYFPEQGEEITWNIKRNNKGEFVTRMVSAIPIAQAPAPAPNQQVVVYTTTPAVATTTTTTTVHQTQTTTTGNGIPSDENVSINMGINVGGEGGSISINASGLDMDTEMNTSGTTTTTHTVTTTTTTTGTAATQPTPTAAPVVYVNGYQGKTGCPIPMNSSDFTSFKTSITSKDFESSRLTIAKQVVQNNCLTADQVKETMQLFDFEATKLDFAKFAYPHTYDQNNYYKVNDAFEFESSISDLNRSIGQ